jgi:phosphomannomutase
LFLLGIPQKHGCSLTDLRRSVRRVFASPELRVPMEVLSYATIAARLKTAFPSAAISSVDGTRLTSVGGVVLARESSTEAAVSLRVEGFTSTAYPERLAELLRQLPEVRDLLTCQLENSTSK